MPTPTEIAMAFAFTKPSNVMDNAWMNTKSVAAVAFLLTAGTPGTTDPVETNVSTNTTNAMENALKVTVLVEATVAYVIPHLIITTHVEEVACTRVAGLVTITDHAEKRV